MQRFHFPIDIIDEDFRSEYASGLGVRAPAQSSEKEGFEVLGAASYADPSQFAQQHSRASAFILSSADIFSVHRRREAHLRAHPERRTELPNGPPLPTRLRNGTGHEPEPTIDSLVR